MKRDLVLSPYNASLYGPRYVYGMAFCQRMIVGHGSSRMKSDHLDLSRGLHMAGSWILTDDGEFILDPIYEERLVAIKTKLRDRWLETICCELSKETGYSEELLLDEFLSRCEKETDELPIDMVDSFIIEALEGSI